MTHNDTEIVSTLLASLASKVGKERFDVWFGANTRLHLAGDSLTVRVPSAFYQDWLRSNFRPHIEAACLETLGRPMSIAFEIDESLAAGGNGASAACVKPRGSNGHADPETPQPAIKSAGEAQARPRRRLPELSGFVVGPSNRLAHSAALQTVERLGQSSPLVMHGPPGVGKTHLLEGIIGGVRRANPRASAVYLSAEQFLTLFLEALQGSGLPSFRRKYRGVDLLVVDDIHFLAGKRATLVEFQHTLDTLGRDGRQIVLASDRSPIELTEFGPELVTRLRAGLVCSIDTPDAATRSGIVARVAAELNVQLPAEAADYIVSRLGGTAREITGAVKRLHAVSQALERPITLALAHEALDELIQSSHRAIRLNDIERAVCQVFGLDQDTLQSSRKARHVSHPRMLAMWLARKHTRAALSEIGDYFGRRSHSTVVSAQNRVDDWVKCGAKLRVADLDCSAETAIHRVEEQLRAG